MLPLKDKAADISAGNKEVIRDVRSGLKGMIRGLRRAIIIMICNSIEYCASIRNIHFKNINIKYTLLILFFTTNPETNVS